MIIYDCEIVNAIQGKGEERLPDIQYCEGWRDFEGMGISTICAYDYTEERYRIFLADNMDAFRKLVASTDLVIGFNSIAFDNPLCRANDIQVPDEKSWDLLAEIWIAAGLTREFQYPSHLGFSLQACSSSNFSTTKSGDGALAPIAWQRGCVGAVVDYCMTDIIRTKALVDKVIETGGIADPRDSRETLSILAPNGESWLS